MALSASLQDLHAYATYAMKRGMKTGLFQVNTLLGAVANKQSVTGPMGEPGVGSVIGRPLSVAQRETMTGSSQRHIPFQTGRVGGGKFLETDGTTSSAGSERSDAKRRTTAISWSFYEQPLALRNSTLRKAKNEYELASPVEDAVQMAMNEANEKLAESIWIGAPSDYTSDDYDDLVGVEQWIDDDNTIGSIDRSSVTGFNGVREDSATTISLSTIDDANLDATSGLALYGGKSDLAIGPSNIYNNLKQESLAAGGQLYLSEKPDGQPVGFTGEYINYNNTMITFDPNATNAAGTADYFLITDTSTWMLEIHSEENWRVIPFKNLADDGPPGSQDLTVSKIRAGLRWCCDQPWKSKFYSDAS